MKTTLLIILAIYFIGCCSSNEEETVKGGPKDFAQVKSPHGNDIVFSEVFDDDWQSRWIISESPEFTGIWRVGEGDDPYFFEQDKGLIIDTKARKHAISVPFDKVLNNKDKDLYIQYELRLQKNLDCGGAYIKLLTVDDSDDDLELKQFNNAYPYTVMFGPDKCGVSNKVHFIVRHKNPVSGKFEEKHLKNPPALKTDTKTHLYTLHILKDNTFKILIDNEEAKSGNLLEDFDPPFNPPEEIDDPDDRKPADWVDEAKISDPDAVKPDDWDETAPAKIVDENDQKPDTWLDDEPLTIPDPAAIKPEDWDDELDGEWDAPQVPNPKCENGQCGTWAPRYIANPAYKGKWKAPLIDNPDYIGVWAPRKIPNPYYFVEENPHNLDKMGALGIEIWTMTDGILFDNFIISYNSADIDKFTSETWTKKNKEEEAILVEETAKNTPPFTQQALEFATKNYLWIGTGTATILAIVVALFCTGGSNKKKDIPTPSSPSKKKKAD